MTLCIELHAFPTHLRCISKALPCTLTHCISDSACYTAPHHPLHLHLHTCCLCLFVCLFTFVTGTHCKCLNSELGAQTALHLSVSKGVIQRKKESQSSATSSSNDNSRPGPMAQAVHTGMKYILIT